jgi:5-methylcytosine-specific restriction endonuclease McrA
MSFKYHYLKKQIYQELFPTGIEEYECTYCSNKVYRHNCTLDHVIPVSKNGSHIRENLVISCQNCNWTKESKTLQEFF